MFDTYYERAALHRTERIMDAAQSSIYAQLTAEGRRKTWNGWQAVITNINTFMIHSDSLLHRRGKNPITWNGQRLSIKGLAAKFAQTWGKKAVVT